MLTQSGFVIRERDNNDECSYFSEFGSFSTLRHAKLFPNYEDARIWVGLDIDDYIIECATIQCESGLYILNKEEKKKWEKKRKRRRI